MAEENRLAGEAWAGLAASLVALPQSIAFGVAIYAALGPAYAAYGALAGFLGASAIGLTTAVVGGAPRLISSPCAPAAALMAPLAAELLARTGSPERVMVLLVFMGLLVGMLQMAYGLLGGGRLIKYIPYPVVTGYMSGVAILILLSQGPRLLGLPKDAALLPGLLHPGLWRWQALSVGAATILAMVFGPRWTKKVPATLIGVAGGALAYLLLGALDPALHDIASNPFVVGPLGAQGAGFGAWSGRWTAAMHGGLEDIKLLFFPALTLSVLLSVDTLKTGVVLDALTKSRHSSNRELFGQGLGNLISGLSGGVPGSATMAGTLVNLSSGGVGRASGIFSGLFTVLAFLLLGKAVAWVPFAALAGILLVLAVRMFDWSSFRLLRQRTTWFDFTVAGAVVVTAVAWDLVAAAGAGVILAMLLFIRDQMHSSVVRRKIYGDKVSSRQKRLPEEADILAQEGGKIAIFELQGSLFFGTTDQLFTEVEPEFALRRYFIFDMRRVLSVDFTAVHMLEMIEARLAEKGGRLLFADIPKTSPTGQDLELYFGQLGLTAPSKRVHVFPTLDDAFIWAEDRILAKNIKPAGPGELLPLAEIDLIKGLEPELTDALAGCVREKSFAPGEVLFHQGDPAADEMFLIRRGKVRIELELDGAGARKHLATIGKGDFLGEMAFLDRAGRSATATAVTPADCFVLSRACFDASAPRHPDMGRKFFWRLSRALSARLRAADAEIRVLYEA